VTYYRTKITLEVLSEDPIPRIQDLGSILEDCDTGPYVLGGLDMGSEVLTREEMDRALIAAGSNETFFCPEGEMS